MRVMKARDLDTASPLVCFCEVAARDPFFLVGKRDRSSFRLADLTGLKVAIVSEVPTPWLCLQHDLREHGIDPARINRVADQTMGDNLEALRKGGLDVVQMFEPYVSMALQASVGDILYAASERGPTVYTTFLASRDSIRRNRAAFEAIVHARAARWPGWRSRAVRDWLMQSRHSTRTSDETSLFPRFDAIAKRTCGPVRRRCHGRALFGWRTVSGPAGSSHACIAMMIA